MTIEYTAKETIYRDMNGDEIHEGDVVFMNGRNRKVYLTDQNELGIDATNPVWIGSGKACECEYGVYPFTEEDEPVLVRETTA